MSANGGRAASAASDDETPVLRVITPDATDEEVAAMVAVVSALGSGGAPAPKKPAKVWSAPARLHRTTYASGRGAWRASGLPH